jgi:uncharacterized protein (DUF1330 family)
MTKGYIFAEVDIHTPGPEWDAYSSQVQATLDSYGGTFVIRGGFANVLEGAQDTGVFVMLEFDSVEKAQAWYASPEYQRLVPIRQRNADARVVCLGGAG